MRPTPELLDHFAKLAELNQNERRTALKGLVNQKEIVSDDEVNKYCQERLISGLASNRAAARIGFSTALLMFLSSDAGQNWTVENLIQVANKKIDLNDKTVASSHAIGHFLLLTTFANSNKTNPEEISQIVEHIKMIKENNATLSFPLTKLLADFSLTLKEKTFNENASQYVESILETINSSFTSENITLALTLRQKYPKIVSKYAKFVKKDGKVQFSDDAYPKLLLAVKRCDASNCQVFLDLLISASNDSNGFEKLYSSVIEPWALASNEAKVLDRIFGAVKSFFDNGGDPKLLVVIFSKEVLNRMEMAVRGKGQFRLLRNSVQNFGNYVQSKLSTLDGDEAYETLKQLQARGNVDRACSVPITSTLLSKLNKKNVKQWINDNIKNQEELRKITLAFSTWDESSKSTVLSALLSEKSTETIQTVTTSAIDSLFYVKNRAGQFASIQLSENNEQLLRKLVVGVAGEETVKKAEKSLAKSTKRNKSLKVLWLMTRIWSAVAPSIEDSESYDTDSAELLSIAKNEDDKNNSQIFVDLLIGILSREKKFHRTPVAFAFSHALDTLKSKDLIHIVETAMMGEKDLIDDEEDMEDEEGMPFDESEIPTKSDENSDTEDEDEDDEDDADGEEAVDQELLDKLNEALGDAAEKDEKSDIEMDDYDEEEMLKMDERLAAAFKALGPKKNKKQSSKNVEALKMKLADVLLIAISSADVSEKNKVKLIVPLLKWAKIDQKQHDKVAQRAISLIGVIVKIKMTGIPESEIISLLKLVIEEAQDNTNLLISDMVARVIGFALRTSASEESISEPVKKEFLKLYENFFKNVEGKIPAEFVIKPILEQPKLFVVDLPMLIDSGFDENNRIFKRTEVLNAVAKICSKQVFHDNTVDKSVAKKVAKLSGEYFKKIIDEDSSEIKPRLLASVLQVIVNIATLVSEDEKLVEILHEKLGTVLIKMSTGDVFAKLKKMNSACQQVMGRSFSGALEIVKKKLEINEN